MGFPKQFLKKTGKFFLDLERGTQEKATEITTDVRVNVEHLTARVEDATAAARRAEERVLALSLQPSAPQAPPGPTLEQFARVREEMGWLQEAVVQNRTVINQLSETAVVVHGLRSEVEILVQRAKFEISTNLHSDESKSRDQNLKVFEQLSKSQQRLYDAKIESLEKQMVGMQQNFSQIVGQFSQKIEALTAENAKIRLENAARPSPPVQPSVPIVIQPVPAACPPLAPQTAPFMPSAAAPQWPRL